MALRVLIVEDEHDTRRQLVSALQEDADFALAGEAASLTQGRKLLAEAKPDLLLTDLGLPDGHGIELIREAFAAGTVLSLVISVFGDEESVLEAIRAGASGYLLKGAAPDAVADALRQVRDGGSPIHPAIARHLIQLARGTGPKPAPDAPKLSDRELEVLRAIVKGFTYQEIATGLGLSTATIATHVRKVYRKLAVHSRGEATYEALQLGLVASDD